MNSIFDKIKRNFARDRTRRDFKTVGLNFLIGFYYSTLFFGTVTIFAVIEVGLDEVFTTPFQAVYLLHISGVISYVVTKFLGFKDFGLSPSCMSSGDGGAFALILIFSVLSIAFCQIVF